MLGRNKREVLLEYFMYNNRGKICIVGKVPTFLIRIRYRQSVDCNDGGFTMTFTFRQLYTSVLSTRICMSMNILPLFSKTDRVVFSEIPRHPGVGLFYIYIYI